MLDCCHCCCWFLDFFFSVPYELRKKNLQKFAFKNIKPAVCVSSGKSKEKKNNNFLAQKLYEKKIKKKQNSKHNTSSAFNNITAAVAAAAAARSIDVVAAT